MAKLDVAKLQSVLEEANAKIAKLTAKLEDAEQAKDDAEKERDDAIAECDKLKGDLAEKPMNEAASSICYDFSPYLGGIMKDVANKFNGKLNTRKRTVIFDGSSFEDDFEKAVKYLRTTNAKDKKLGFSSNKFGNGWPSTPLEYKVEDGEYIEDEYIDDVERPAEVVDTTELDKFKEIADTPEELEVTLKDVEETLKKCESDAKELEDTKEKLAEAEEEIKDKEEQIKQAEEVIESYVKLGSIATLKAMVESNRKMKNEARQAMISKFIRHYSAKKGITLESVKRIVNNSKSFKAAKMTLESLPNVNPNKGLWQGESATVKKVSSSPMATFAESMINKMEQRRNRNYTA